MVYPTLDAPMDAVITLMPIAMVDCAADLLWSPVLRGFPALKFAPQAGSGSSVLLSGWTTSANSALWTRKTLVPSAQRGVPRASSCFISDRVGIENRHAVGVDNITWECDYPHSDTIWPRAPEILMDHFEGVPDAEIDQITHANAMRHFRYDPFRQLPKQQATVGALRAQAKDVDLSPRSHGGLRPSEGEGIVTAGQVAKQLAMVMLTPE
jgi:hypothetical protein